MKQTFFIAENPFLLLLMPFLAGIFLGVNFSFVGLLFFLKLSIYTITISLVILNFNFSDWNIYKKSWTGGSLMNVLIFLFGILFTEQYKEINQNNHFSKQKANILLVRIIQEPKQNGSIVRFNTCVTHAFFNGKLSETCGSLLVALKLDSSQQNNFNYGDELLIPNNYKPVDAPFNPAEFNYKLWLQHQQIYYQTFINSNQFQLIATDRGNPIITYALQVRKKLVEKFQRYMHNSDAIAVASTLILGYRADLSQDVLQSYSKTGTMHVLSVSGMHVALVYIIIDLLLRFLNRKRSGVLLKALISILLIWIYGLITGFSPAVCRAAVMITFVIVGKTYNKHISMLNILLASAFLLLIYNPFFITDVGFQLSYLAVVGLIILQPIIESWFEFKNKYVQKLWSLLSVSIAAQLITFPISIFYFHQFPVYFLISNLFIVLPSMLIMYIGIVFLFVPNLDVSAKPVAFLLEKTIVLMNQGLAWIENIPFGNWNKLWIIVPEYLLLYAMMSCCFVWLVYRKSIWLKVNAVFTLLFLMSFSFKRYHATNQNELIFFNLKKNFGILFKKGTTGIIVSNLKSTDKTFKLSIQPYLDSCKIITNQIITPNQSFRNAVFNKQKNLIQFENKLIFIADKTFEHQTFPHKIKVGFVLVTDYAKINLNQINKNIIFDLLILDSRNADYQIKKLSEEAALDGRKINILKRNKALVFQSNSGN